MIKDTGAPSAYGINNIKDLVETSRISSDLKENNIFFKTPKL
jgi:hypothetical protein